MANDFIRVERDGWFIDIETLDVSERPEWEIRCLIRRSNERLEEQRGHRFVVSRELSDHYKLGALPEERRMSLMTQAAKKVILREIDDIFDEPEEGLDSVRALKANDLG